MITSKKKNEGVLSKRNTTIVAIFIVLLLFLVIYLPRFIRMMHPFEIATLSVDKSVVEANDNNGKVQWRFKARSDISFSKAIDIDRDNRKEVVIGTCFLLTDRRNEKSNGRDNARLYILNENGRLLFTSEIGMTSIYPKGSSKWSIYNVHFLDIDRDTLIDFITLAVTDDSMDCILFTKTQKGSISKFWHAGKIEHIILFNLSNGEKEIICGGVNKRIGEKQVPLMGVVAAFIFVAQMLNFPVIGGSSGHFLGGVLAAILLGPFSGILIRYLVAYLAA